MSKPIRIALMLDLEWPYKRHVGIFTGTQRYAQEHGWESTVDEYADDTLPKRMLEQPIPDGPAKGEVNRLGEMLPEYYRVRGWTPDGRPTPEKLEELGLASEARSKARPD